MKRIATAVATVALAGGLLTAAPADARRDDVIATRTCSDRSSVKLKLSRENGGIEAELEVDQNVNGQTWRVKLRQNGSVVARAKAVTQPPSGSFEIRRVLPNEPGRDKIIARAKNKATGEVCRVAARW